MAAEKATKTKLIKGRDLRVGDHVQLEDGAFDRVTEIVRAPIRVRDEATGEVEVPKWAYLATNGHTTVCRDDEITVRA